MSGTVCSVAVCKSNFRRAKREGELIRFFTFPKNPEICKEWERRCYRKDPWSSKNKRICSKHFTDKDYQDRLQAQLLNLRPQKLKPTAVPSLHLLPETTSHLELSKSNEKKLVKKNRKQIFDKVPVREDKPIPESASVEIEEDFSNNSECEVDILKNKMNILVKENGKLKKLLEEKNQQVTLLQQKLNELESLISRKNVSNFEENTSPNQLDIVLKKIKNTQKVIEGLTKSQGVRSSSRKRKLTNKK
ncbi:hypothetical protein TcasGA2_TC010989 [Tribolium castaneum]|uniref:THAP-type domain-containing protein n=1 Tax=Tribolium castaneum TaxID=7070 RepID=D6X1G7_TRICA|nr:PREDICTED: THAP domain-containing protein 1 [Tribolium castaneum]EFA09495.1 hypothetical protein TcasGA2_TC010989 [Tribolium castaneum]|eukprot:XP_008199636.1 PREDICTED: THAP domain-containing protein 1 [Tribolium castaneum]